MQVRKSFVVQIAKVDKEHRIVEGVVMKASKQFDENGEPTDYKDTHGNWASVEEVKKACHNFNRKIYSNPPSKKVGVDKQHNDKAGYGVPIESYIAKVDIPELNAEIGDWVAAVEITDDATWKEVEKGEIAGFSIGGSAKITPAKGGEKEDE